MYIYKAGYKLRLFNCICIADEQAAINDNKQQLMTSNENGIAI